MKYITRNDLNRVTGIFTQPQFENQEAVEDDSPIRLWQSPQERLSMLDDTSRVTQRNLREFIALVTEALKTPGTKDLSNVPVVLKVLQAEESAATIRAEL